MRARSWWVFAIVAVLSSRVQIDAATYEFRTIDVPYGSIRETVITAINALGTMVGGVSNHQRPMLPVYSFYHRDGGPFVPLVRNRTVTPQGVTSTRLIVGIGTQADGVDFGTLQRGTSITRHDAPGALQTQFWGVNEAELVTGTCQAPDGVWEGCRYDVPTGEWIFLRHPSNEHMILTASNSAGHSVGFLDQGSSWVPVVVDTNGNVTPRDPPYAGSFEAFWDLNEQGLIVGTTTADGSTYQSFTVDLATWTYTEIVVPDALFVDLYGLNDHGVLVGRWHDLEGFSHGLMAVPQ